MLKPKSFPTSLEELKQLDWDSLDIILISGDAFIDHPSFGTAVIARVLEQYNYRIAIVPQPNWQDDLRDFKKFGKPRLFFGVSSGNLDSMLNHYTATKRKRYDDVYTPGGRSGQRPDYAVNVYSNILKKLYPDVPVIIGGIEASMRRFAHYDYWQDKILSSILESSNADLLAYGMAEKTIVEIAKVLNDGGSIYECYNIPQIAYLSDNKDHKKDDIKLYSFKDVCDDKLKYAENFLIVEKETNIKSNSRIVQDLKTRKLIVNPMREPLSTDEMDNIYGLKYTRLPHERYKNKPAIPAFEMIKFSVNIHRGCFGACSFCTIAAHQGKHIASRSEKSILNELEQISKQANFKGHISDLGGPSANMYKMKGIDENICKKCKKISCCFPTICSNLNNSHASLIQLYDKALKIQNIKKISIGSGIRYDLIINETKNIETKQVNDKYLKLLFTKFISGRLKIAPEHSSDKVLNLMRKNNFKSFKKMKSLFESMNDKLAMQQQLIPYFIAAHPGCTEHDMAELAIETKKMGYKLEQVQIFTPTPMTLSTVMYYTGINPYTKEKIYVAKTLEEKDRQISYLFWYKPEYRKQIIENLNRIKRTDLIKKLLY